jgi:hypothetical protein
MSQNDVILQALKAGPLTPLDALNRFGVFRLAARVCDLRERGYPIAVEKVKTPGWASVARYTLERLG